MFLFGQNACNKYTQIICNTTKLKKTRIANYFNNIVISPSVFTSVLFVLSTISKSVAVKAYLSEPVLSDSNIILGFFNGLLCSGLGLAGILQCLLHCICCILRPLCSVPVLCKDIKECEGESY